LSSRLQPASLAAPQPVPSMAVDSTIVRAHQHAPDACKRGAPDPAGEGLGRSRGRLDKIHLAVEGRGLPVAIVVSAGNVNDCTRFVQVMDAIRVGAGGGTAADQAGAGVGGQGLLVAGDPGLSAWSWDRRDHPGTRRSAGQPVAEGSVWGPAVCVRCSGIPAMQRGRTVFRAAPTVPWAGHSLREAGCPLPGHGGHRIARAVA
jgi:hypothetical protein